MRKNGFTLIELTIVILIISIISIYASMRWPQGMELDAQTEKLASDIRLVQSLAMNRHQRFRINLTATQYQLFDGNNNPLPHPASNNAIIPLEPGVTLTTTNANIIFNSEGVPYTGAFPGILLAANNTITLTDSNGVNRQIITTPETGNTNVQ